MGLFDYVFAWCFLFFWSFESVCCLGVGLDFVYAVIIWFLTYYVRTLVQIAARVSTVKHKFFRDYVKWVKMFESGYGGFGCCYLE